MNSVAEGLGKYSLDRNSQINLLRVRFETADKVLMRCHLYQEWKGKITLKVHILLPPQLQKKKGERSLSDPSAWFNCHFLQPWCKIRSALSLRTFILDFPSWPRLTPTQLNTGFEIIILQWACEGWRKSRRMLGSRAARIKSCIVRWFNSPQDHGNPLGVSHRTSERPKGKSVQAVPSTTAGEAPERPGWIQGSSHGFSTLAPIHYYLYLFKSAGFNSHRAELPLAAAAVLGLLYRFHKIHNSEYQRSENTSFPSQFSALTGIQRAHQTQHHFLLV